MVCRQKSKKSKKIEIEKLTKDFNKKSKGFLNNVDKQMLIQLVNENVIISTQNKIQKGQSLLPFFFI